MRPVSMKTRLFLRACFALILFGVSVLLIAQGGYIAPIGAGFSLIALVLSQRFIKDKNKFLSEHAEERWFSPLELVILIILAVIVLSLVAAGFLTIGR